MFRSIDYRILSRELERMSEIIGSINDELESMQQSATSLNVFWDGEANAEFVLNFNASIFDAKLLLEKLKKCNSFLAYALSRYQSSEGKISEIINEVSLDNGL